MRTSQQEKTDPDRLPAHRLKIRNAGEIDASQYYGNVEMLNAALGAAKPIFLHDGFGAAAEAFYKEVRNLLIPRDEIHVTGHSLGAAIAAILMMYLDTDGFTLKTCYTFGQPKVTNSEGMAKFRHLPLVRVVDNEDIVPLVPPLTIVTALHGEYRHFGYRNCPSRGEALCLSKRA